ncbi:unnamed protein product [Moneuplotes crassus]|uniref:Uncharacterized protein n=1 Tax=Euplotes crassus TaxID=5936 RepID=A0AAD1UCK6_EUPCR|nr:unnamed protein product [Moneuplotes crassus]
MYLHPKYQQLRTCRIEEGTRVWIRSTVCLRSKVTPSLIQEESLIKISCLRALATCEMNGKLRPQRTLASHRESHILRSCKMLNKLYSLVGSREKERNHSNHNSVIGLQDKPSQLYDINYLDKAESFHSSEVQSISSVRSFAQTFKRVLSSTASKALDKMIPHNDYYSYNEPNLRASVPNKSNFQIRKHQISKNLKNFKGLREETNLRTKLATKNLATKIPSASPAKKLKFSHNVLKINDFDRKKLRTQSQDKLRGKSTQRKIKQLLPKLRRKTIKKVSGYSPYTLKSYKEKFCQKSTPMGGLGSNIGSQDWQKAMDKRNRMHLLAKSIEFENKKKLALGLKNKDIIQFHPSNYSLKAIKVGKS